MRLNANQAEAHNNLGVLCEQLRRTDEAIACYQESLRIKPDYLEAISNKGVALGQLGDADGAIACFEQLAALDPDFNGVQNNLKLAHELKQKQQSQKQRP